MPRIFDNIDRCSLLSKMGSESQLEPISVLVTSVNNHPKVTPIYHLKLPYLGCVRLGERDGKLPLTASGRRRNSQSIMRKIKRSRGLK